MSNKRAAEKIVRQLRQLGYEALLAGGCVRDMLLGRRANDYDVATSAKPENVMKIFCRTVKVGAKFGVVIVLLDDEQVEVATFRTEGGYTDGRHPGHVKFSTAKKDAKRRDFTINGMFYDPIERRVIDYVDGRADLKKNLIRTIGKATERFGEDYLRMLRAVRFSTKLGFEIESETYKSIRRTAEKINLISGERIAMELEGIVTNAGRAAGIEMLIDCG
ncbi:MAG: CCA tRNA nucleotidyltransferase, partial [Phycisphaerae bacterium]